MTEHDTQNARPDGLTPAQLIAADRLFGGATDGEAAEAAGVSRQTVWAWRNRNPHVRAELNRRREEMRRATDDMVIDLEREVVARLRRAVREDEGDMGTRAALKLYDLAGLGSRAARRTIGPTDARKVAEQDAIDDRLNKLYGEGLDGYGSDGISEEEVSRKMEELTDLADLLEDRYGPGAD